MSERPSAPSGDGSGDDDGGFGNWFRRISGLLPFSSERRQRAEQDREVKDAFLRTYKERLESSQRYVMQTKAGGERLIRSAMMKSSIETRGAFNRPSKENDSDSNSEEEGRAERMLLEELTSFFSWEEGRAERMILEELTTSWFPERKRSSIVYGIGIGIASFAALRVGRRISLGSALTSGVGRSGGYRLESPPAANRRRSRLVTSFWLAIDACAGLFASYKSYQFLLLRPPLPLREAADVPLVEGRSHVSNVFCQPFTKEYLRVQKEIPGFWERHGSLDDDDRKGRDEKIAAIRLFVENCQRRAEMEKRLMKAEEDHQSSKGSVSVPTVQLQFPLVPIKARPTPSIPSPGVPKDIDFRLGDDVER